MELVRELIFYWNYFKDFFDRQAEKVKEKIDQREDYCAFQ